MDIPNIQNLIEHGIVDVPLGTLLLWFIRREFTRFENRQDEHSKQIGELRDGHGRHNVRLGKIEYAVEHHDTQMDVLWKERMTGGG